MCKRFIEDLANKIIEKNDFENLTIAELQKINKKAVEIINKRRQIVVDEINKSYQVGDYLIGRSAGASGHITLLHHPNDKFTFYYLTKDMYKPFCFRKNYGDPISSFSTKEELVNHICLTINVEDKKTLYDICLKKITCIQDLVDTYQG